jgi:hypothetical protein
LDGTRGTHGGGAKVYRVLMGKPEGKNNLEDQGVDERILGRLAGGWGVHWIQLAQDRGRWLALVNTVMNLQVLAPRS